MKKLIKNLILFFFLISLILTIIFYYFYKIGGDDLPAPAFSNSISFNEKIDFIKDKDLSKIEYIVLGSSMSLNNINSQIMVNALGENYLNLASWGFKISGSERYLKEMIDHFPNLKAVVISTGFMDFTDKVRNIKVDYDLINNTINYDLDEIAYLALI